LFPRDVDMSTQEKEEEFLPPLPRGKGGATLPQSQSEVVVSRVTTVQVPPSQERRKRRASTGMVYPAMPALPPRSESKRVTRIIEGLRRQGNQMSPIQRQAQLSRGLTDVVVLKETKSLRLLLDQGASPNGSSKSPCTPLYVAVDMQLPGACRILLDAGASLVRTSQKQRQSPLQLAIKERPAMLPILFDRVSQLEEAYLGKRNVPAPISEEEEDEEEEDLPAPKRSRPNNN